MPQPKKLTEIQREKLAVNEIESATCEIRELFKEILPEGLPQATLTVAYAIIADLEEASQRVADGRILVAIVGGRGGGKSSFINAILNYNLLPEGPVEACTTFPAIVSFSTQHELKVDSENPKYCTQLEELSRSDLKNTLRHLLDEEFNRDNVKRLKSVNVGVPENILRRIELADVPGFTLGNKRQQLLAERYSTQKADLALVLLNNADSVEIRGIGGLDGLASCFKNRLKSTIFIVNKADEDESLEYFEKLKHRFIGMLQTHGADTSDVRVYAVSARATLKKWSNTYEFDKILRDFVAISGQSRVFAAAGSFDRVADSLSALCILCRKDRDVLLELRERLVQLSQVELHAHADRIQDLLLYKGIIEAQRPPKVDFHDLALPLPNSSELPANYTSRLFRHIQEDGARIVNRKVENYLADIEEGLRCVLEKRTSEVATRVKMRVEEIEDRFGIRGEVSIPRIPNGRTDYEFDDNLVSHLKPRRHRILLEKLLPFEWLHRSIALPIFDKATIQTLVGGVELDFGSEEADSADEGRGLLKSTAKQMQEAYERCSRGTAKMSNIHIKFVSESHVGRLLRDYENAYREYVDEWEDWLGRYQNLVDLALRVSSNEVQKKITDAAKGLRYRANRLRH